MNRLSSDRRLRSFLQWCSSSERFGIGSEYPFNFNHCGIEKRKPKSNGLPYHESSARLCSLPAAMKKYLERKRGTGTEEGYELIRRFEES